MGATGVVAEGNIFTIKGGSKSITITQFGVHARETVTYDKIVVYTYSGSASSAPMTSSSWKLISTSLNVQGKGLGQVTYVTLQSGLTISAYSEITVYICSTTSGQRFVSQPSTSSISLGDFTVTPYSANRPDFGYAWVGYAWNGAVKYYLN